MASFPRSSTRLPIVIIAAFFVIGLAACNDDKPVSAPVIQWGSITFTTAIVPQQLVVTPIVPIVAAGCPLFPTFATQFDLLVNTTNTVALNAATFQLISGEHLGGSPLVVSATDLAARFGSTTVRAGTQRTFTFFPQFTCVAFQPQALLANVVLLDQSGTRHTQTMTVPVF
jgi:hypothetical protein